MTALDFKVITDANETAEELVQATNEVPQMLHSWYIDIPSNF